MNSGVLKYGALILLFLSFGCGARKIQTLKQPPLPPPEAPRVTGAEETGRPDEAPVTTPAAAAPGEKSESATAGEGSEGAPSLPEKIQAEISVIPPAEEIPENETPFAAEIADAPENGEAGETGQQILDSALDLVNSAQEFWAEGNQDQALAALDEAYGLAVRVDTGESPELIQQKDDLRYMISRRILEIYASRFTTTNGNHNEIPVILNEYVEKEIRRFQGPERAFFIRAHQRSGRYMPMILESLREAGLPEDLAWIPLIESGFNVNALSSARALGLWQFIASTGQKFGLKRDTWIDERMDPEKSTAAAVAYLKELHQIFGDWTTVLAGYNCGEGAVLRKIRNQKINYLDNFWDLFQQLPYETARYVPRFLATLHILKDPVKYGFDLETQDSPVAYETVTITKAVKLSAIAQAITVPEEELSALNSELRHKSTPSTPYNLRVPEGKAEPTLARIDDIPIWTPPKNTTLSGSHTVRKGETLSDIARRYKTSVARIAQANKIRENSIIRIGQKLKVPQNGAAGATTQSSSGIKLQPGGKYLVKKGDTLWLIAKKFNTDTKKIQQLNKLKDTRLLVGQTLLIPE